MDAQARRAELKAEVVGLLVNREALAMAGMLGKLERCGRKSRSCIRVDERARGYGNQADHRVILGC